MQRIAAIIGLAVALLAADPAIAGPPSLERLSWPPRLTSFVSSLRCCGLCEWVSLGHSCKDSRFTARARAEGRGRAPELHSGH